MGAYGGSLEVMSNVAPVGDVYQAGTLSGNPIATAAGLAQLQLLDDSAYERLGIIANRLSKGLNDAFTDAGIDAVIPQVGSLLSIFFTQVSPTNFDEAQNAAENGQYRRFFHSMLSRGVALAPGPYEALFPSLAHTDEVIDRTIEIAHEAALEIAS